MAETIYIKGEGGSVFAMDLPLPEAIQDRLDRKQVQRVNADGSPYRGVTAAALEGGPNDAGDQVTNPDPEPEPARPVKRTPPARRR